jgi:hypothetical protein
VRVYSVCVVLCVGSGLAKGWSPVQGVLPTEYRIRKLKRRPRPNIRAVEPSKERIKSCLDQKTEKKAKAKAKHKGCRS